MAKVLIVDDEIALLEIMAESFEEFGFAVVTAKDGEEAKEILSRQAESIDMILSDIHMPRCNGIALLKYANKYHSGIPFSFMTGFSDFEFHELQKMGAEQIFLKPLKLKKLKLFLEEKFATKSVG